MLGSSTPQVTAASRSRLGWFVSQSEVQRLRGRGRESGRADGVRRRIRNSRRSARASHQPRDGLERVVTAERVSRRHPAVSETRTLGFTQSRQDDHSALERRSI
ncbi:hypothetical protein HBNXHx_1586 [Haloferax volcanii]|nr:hypothetical protein HBNXHx_1586 [Haloferax alexandrinus]